MKPQRIMIFGRPGSGKSGFAQALAQRLGLPVYHTDKIFYVKNWVERDHDEFIKMQKAIVAEPRWVIDGNAMRSLELRYARAEVAIVYCLPKRVCLWRILKRVFTKRRETIDDRAEGCEDRFNWRLIDYMMKFDDRLMRYFEPLKKIYPDVKLYYVRSDEDAKKLMDLLVKES